MKMNLKVGKLYKYIDKIGNYFGEIVKITNIEDDILYFEVINTPNKDNFYEIGDIEDMCIDEFKEMYKEIK